MDDVRTIVERARFTRSLLRPGSVPNIADRMRPIAPPTQQPQRLTQLTPQNAPHEDPYAYAPQRRTVYTDLMKKHDKLNPRIK